jgi:hypothetical protein
MREGHKIEGILWQFNNTSGSTFAKFIISSKDI